MVGLGEGRELHRRGAYFPLGPDAGSPRKTEGAADTAMNGTGQRSFAMKADSSPIRPLVGICAVLLVAAGCAGSQPQTNSLPSSEYGAGGGAPGSSQGAAAISPDVQTQDLLYVARSKDGDVAVYSYPEGTPKGRLAGVRANGLCSGPSGDVYIPEGNEILKYAHGASRPSEVLRDTLGGAAQFCSVDPASGSLAVSGGTYPRFGVAVYAGATGTPTTYVGSLDAGYWSCTYDRQGDLFVEAFRRLRPAAGALGARSTPLAVNLLELPRGATRFMDVAWQGTRPPRLGSIQWDGQYLAAESPGSGSTAMSILRYAVSARQARFVGQAVLRNAGNPAQVWIHGSQVVVPNQGLNDFESSGLMLYDYPAGGTSTGVIKDDGAPQTVTVSVASAKNKIAVTTYHYDNLRTGWDDHESTLTYKKLKDGKFGLLHTVTLDDQVDAQPLLVPGETTTRGVAPGKHDVVYVETENDSVYAIDASSGTILFEQSLGSPVQTPLGCNNNGPNVGITGTPVIDLSANVMYVIAYTLVASTPVYTIHELNLANLEDAVTPVVVTASHKLTNDTSYTFNATYERQRPGLLEANGNVYAGFGSFCDLAASSSRGWLLGWQAGSLTPLAANRLNNSLATSPNDFFLSSVWMSGYGVAADSSGNVYFVTGNSDPSGTTYNGVTNVQESVVKVSADLTQLLSIFTPSDVGELDEYDADFGAGGVLLLPTIGSSGPALAAAAGKDGNMYLMDQDSLGGYSPSGNDVLATEQIGGCWCGLSYFDAASDSLPRIVASGGNNVSLWKVKTSPSTQLIAAGSSPGLPGGQDPGFFTTVSSQGSKPDAIVWALARPQYVPGNMTLFAFKGQPPRHGSTLDTLYEGTAGYWTAANGNANLVPVVANGNVYVASYEQLDIFGIGKKFAKALAPHAVALRPTANAPHEVTGTLLKIDGSRLTLRTRTGAVVAVDDSAAVRHERAADLVVGQAFNVHGSYDALGVLHAALIVRAKPSPGSWPPDR